MQCTPRYANNINFLLLPELTKPLEKICSGKSRVLPRNFLGEVIRHFSKLPQREQDRRYIAMGKLWPRRDPRYRDPKDRTSAIVTNAMIAYWLESQHQ